MLGITRTDKKRSTWNQGETKIKDIVEVIKRQNGGGQST